MDEKTTLKDLLSVKKLYSVRIMNNGVYVSCHYTTDKWPVKLDVSPEKDVCLYAPHGGKWKSTASGESVCMEKNVSKCEFTYTCKEAH